MDSKLTKKEFVKIINKLQAANDMCEQINDIIRKNQGNFDCDFISAYGFGVMHDDLVVSLLEKNMHDKDEYISYFVYEQDFGRAHKIGDVKDNHGNNIDLSTAEKLYDFLSEYY